MMKNEAYVVYHLEPEDPLDSAPNEDGEYEDIIGCRIASMRIVYSKEEADELLTKKKGTVTKEGECWGWHLVRLDGED